MLSFPMSQYSENDVLAPMSTTWNTENLGGTGSATKVLLLPMTAGNKIDWGDGTINNLNTHTYASGGVKTVKIYGIINSWTFNNLGDKLKITDVSDVGGWRPRADGFYGCSNLTWTATGPLNNKTLVTNISGIFRDCTLFNGDVTSWDVSKILNLGSTFRDCPAFNQDISGWDVSNVTTNLSSMLRGCTIFNQDVSGWDVSNVNTFASAFRDCAALNPNIGGWDTSSCTTINNMVRNSLFNRDISGWDVSGVTTATNFANGSSFSTTNYDLLLPAWEAQSVQNNVSIHFGSATYGAGTPATARAALIADHTWTITDGGPT